MARWWVIMIWAQLASGQLADLWPVSNANSLRDDFRLWNSELGRKPKADSLLVFGRNFSLDLEASTNECFAKRPETNFVPAISKSTNSKELKRLIEFFEKNWNHKPCKSSSQRKFFSSLEVPESLWENRPASTKSISPRSQELPFYGNTHTLSLWICTPDWLLVIATEWLDSRAEILGSRIGLALGPNRVWELPTISKWTTPKWDCLLSDRCS